MNTLKKKLYDLQSEMAASIVETQDQWTTLDLKNELIKQYPEIMWQQSAVSQWLDDNYASLKLSYTDNGTYRTYSKLKTVDLKSKKKSNKVSKTSALETIVNSNGQWMTIDFVKKDGTDRRYNCKYDRSMSDISLGYVKLKGQKGEIRNVNLQTIKQIRTRGKTIKVA